jgi:hypothetical protein
MSQLSKEQREELTHWAQSRTLPAGDVFHARLVLALAEGKSWSQIENRVAYFTPHRCPMEAPF